ncbi:hypothetical protein P280DRAFT_507690 [Massarina eburnea CBS 473.64]|uniref:Uncharacterized protein n=1 Tax=Massarina eburnea CBS 473.64 TaxID=1395130 RepID=A0A6A6S132_9PLEO|nr:hypothetical protein P280DRAFT_507690 [Massarina eburnea CBS 473.64]
MSRILMLLIVLALCTAMVTASDVPHDGEAAAAIPVVIATWYDWVVGMLSTLYIAVATLGLMFTIFTVGKESVMERHATGLQSQLTRAEFFKEKWEGRYWEYKDKLDKSEEAYTLAQKTVGELTNKKCSLEWQLSQFQNGQERASLKLRLKNQEEYRQAAQEGELKLANELAEANSKLKELDQSNYRQKWTEATVSITQHLKTADTLRQQIEQLESKIKQQEDGFTKSSAKLREKATRVEAEKRKQSETLETENKKLAAIVKKQYKDLEALKNKQAASLKRKNKEIKAMQNEVCTLKQKTKFGTAPAAAAAPMMGTPTGFPAPVAMTTAGCPSAITNQQQQNVSSSGRPTFAKQQNISTFGQPGFGQSSTPVSSGLQHNSSPFGQPAFGQSSTPVSSGLQRISSPSPFGQSTFGQSSAATPFGSQQNHPAPGPSSFRPSSNNAGTFGTPVPSNPSLKANPPPAAPSIHSYVMPTGHTMKKERPAGSLWLFNNGKDLPIRCFDNAVIKNFVDPPAGAPICRPASTLCPNIPRVLFRLSFLPFVAPKPVRRMNPVNQTSFGQQSSLGQQPTAAYGFGNTGFGRQPAGFGSHAPVASPSHFAAVTQTQQSTSAWGAMNNRPVFGQQSSPGVGSSAAFSRQQPNSSPFAPAPFGSRGFGTGQPNNNFANTGASSSLANNPDFALFLGKNNQ